MTMSESPSGPLDPSNEETVDIPDTANEERMQQLARRQKRMLYVSMSATLLLGLTTTASYIRGRMVEAAPVAPAVTRPRSATPAVQKASPLAAVEHPKATSLPAPTVVATPAPDRAPTLTSNATLNLIDPRAGEVYLQLAALDLQRSQNYVGYLEQSHYHARIAPGPSQDLYRVLLGPFPAEAEMLKTKARLDQDRIECILRTY